MTLYQAERTPTELMSYEDLWTAIKRIGAYKLALRRTRRLADVMPLLRELNSRIDELIAEEINREASARATRRARQTA